MTLGVPWEVIERDYLLSWVLAGISRVSANCDPRSMLSCPSTSEAHLPPIA